MKDVGEDQRTVKDSQDSGLWKCDEYCFMCWYCPNEKNI